MKKINLLLLFLLLACALPAQDGISVFIGRANRYASVELSDYRKRLCLEYNISNHSLDDYYRRCGNDWGNVGIALEIARTSGKKMRDVCDYYKRYHRYGWNRILVEIGIKPGSMYYNPFYNRVHHHSDCWHEYYIHTVNAMTNSTIRNTNTKSRKNTTRDIVDTTTMTMMMTTMTINRDLKSKC